MKVLPSHWSSASFVFGVIFFTPWAHGTIKRAVVRPAAELRCGCKRGQGASAGNGREVSVPLPHTTSHTITNVSPSLPGNRNVIEVFIGLAPPGICLNVSRCAYREEAHGEFQASRFSCRAHPRLPPESWGCSSHRGCRSNLNISLQVTEQHLPCPLLKVLAELAMLSALKPIPRCSIASEYWKTRFTSAILFL